MLLNFFLNQKRQTLEIPSKNNLWKDHNGVLNKSTQQNSKNIFVINFFDPCTVKLGETEDKREEK